MKLYKCPKCGKPNTKWRFRYLPVTLEGVWSQDKNHVVVHPPLVVRNNITPEEAIVNGSAVIICPKCEEETRYGDLEYITICDIRRTVVPTTERTVTIMYRTYGSSQTTHFTITLDVDTDIDDETLRKLLSVD